MHNHGEPSLKLYEEEFESAFLTDTIEYYRLESQNQLLKLPVSQFMQVANERLLEETERNSRFILPSSHEKTILAVEKEYIGAHLQAIQEEFAASIMEENLLGCLLAYKLVSRIPEGIKDPLHCFEKHVTKCAVECANSMDSKTQKVSATD